MLPAAGASHQSWNGYGLSSFFKGLSWSSRKFLVSLSIFTREYQIIYQLCWQQKEMSFKTQLYEDVMFSLLLVYFESYQKHSHSFSQPKI